MRDEVEYWDRAIVLRFFGGIHTSTLYRGIAVEELPKAVSDRPEFTCAGFPRNATPRGAS